MGERPCAGSGGGAAMTEEAAMDPRDAATIMRDAGEHARRELNPNDPVIYASWALVLLLTNGIIWLAVRGQRPYLGPPGWALGVVAGLVVIFLIAYAAVISRAASGVGGATARRRRAVCLSVAAGLVAVFAVEGGLRASGASIGTTDLVGASGPILVYGLAIAGSAAASRQRTAAALGLWLIAVAAGSAFASAAAVWGIDAIAPSAGILIMVAVRRRRLSGPSRPGPS